MNIPHFPPPISQWIKARKHDIPPRNSNYLLALLSCVLAFIRVSTDTCELSSARVFTTPVELGRRKKKKKNSAVKNMTFRRGISSTFWRSPVCPWVGPDFTRVERESYEHSVLSAVSNPMERGPKK
jgi:hypothetical protein